MSNTVIRLISFYQLSAWQSRCCPAATITFYLLTTLAPSSQVLAMGHINRKHFAKATKPLRGRSEDMVTYPC